MKIAPAFLGVTIQEVCGFLGKRDSNKHSCTLRTMALGLSIQYDPINYKQVHVHKRGCWGDNFICKCKQVVNDHQPITLTRTPPSGLLGGSSQKISTSPWTYHYNLSLALNTKERNFLIIVHP